MRLIFLILTLLSPTLLAQTTLPEVVVTATRSPQSTAASMASVTIITRQEILQSQVSTLPELLQGVSGLDVVSSGSYGQPSSIFIRGTGANHVLLLVDGVKVGSASLGLSLFEQLPLAHIERIEIVRGPRASLYGSEAIGGVIQIFTHKGKTTPTMTASVGMGNQATYQATATLTGAAKKTRYALSAEHFQSDGINSCRGSLEGGCFTLEPDEDSYQNTSVGLQLGQDLTDRLSVDGQFLRIDSQADYDSPGNNQADFTQQIIGLQSTMIMNDQWDLNMNVGEDQEEQTHSGHSQLPNDHYNTKRRSLSVQNNFSTQADRMWNIGYDYQEDTIESNVAYTVDSRTNHGYFIQYQSPSILLGIRQDDNEQFGQQITYNSTLSYPITASTKLSVSYGTAFKAPTFNELYYPGFEGYPGYGNPHLKPEEASSLEVGLKGRQPDYDWSLHLFRTQIENAIGGYPAENIDEAEITGMDGFVDWQKNNWEFKANATWLNPENKLTGKRLPRRAERTLFLEIAENRKPMRFAINTLLQSDRYDDVANTRQLDGYFLINLAGEYQLNPYWSLKARVGNLFDKDYETAAFYHNPGRSFFISLHYQPKTPLVQ